MSGEILHPPQAPFNGVGYILGLIFNNSPAPITQANIDESVRKAIGSGNIREEALSADLRAKINTPVLTTIDGGSAKS